MRVGVRPSAESIEKNRQAHLGKHLSLETKVKLRQVNLGKIVSLETREKIRQFHLGKSLSLMTRKKISDAHKRSGHQPPSTKCVHPSSETIEKIRQALLGEKHPNWQGGISFAPYPTGWVEVLKESIRTRDHHSCQLCDVKQEKLLKKLDVHHIDYDKKNLDPKNLISLCRRCHIRTNDNREKWIDLFHQL